MVDSKKKELNNFLEYTQIRVVKAGSGSEGGEIKLQSSKHGCGDTDTSE